MAVGEIYMFKGRWASLVPPQASWKKIVISILNGTNMIVILTITESFVFILLLLHLGFLFFCFFYTSNAEAARRVNAPSFFLGGAPF